MYTAFTSLNVFNDNRLNTYLDTIYSAVLEVFTTEQIPVICGSVAKVMQGVRLHSRELASAPLLRTPAAFAIS